MNLYFALKNLETILGLPKYYKDRTEHFHIRFAQLFLMLTFCPTIILLSKVRNQHR